MVAPRHRRAAQVAEAVPAPASDEGAAVHPLDVDLALGAPLPLALLRHLPQQQVLPPALVVPEPLELGALHPLVPRHLALRAEHPLAMGALHLGRRVAVAVPGVVVHQQRRAVLEGAVELELAERHVAERGAPPVEQRRRDHAPALLRVQHAVLAARIRAADGQQVLLDPRGDVLPHAAGAERVPAPGDAEPLDAGDRLHADRAVEFLGAVSIRLSRTAS
uniref:Uncharacterized protein n=1 Tax=Triticum urartu TaxID=4572 RepID=A0A8R7VAW5_TRIUA